MEIEGVLKAGLCPKDHYESDYRRANHNRRPSYSYKYFEGAIPEGNYGEGKVIVCDNGTYNLTENSENVDIFKEDLDLESRL
jgi:hypothetical protein